jgi:hypothetical protein
MQILLISIVGAIISRFHGGGFISGISKSLKNTLWATPFGVVTYLILLQNNVNIQLAVGLSIMALTLCLVGKATGHGRVWNPYLPLNTEVKKERVEYLISCLSKRIPDFWYKTLAMGLIGFAAVSGAAIVIGFVDPFLGTLIGLGGFIGKPLSYLIGWKLPFIEHGNEIGEYGTGLFAYFMLGLALVKVI